MPFSLAWTDSATAEFERLETAARKASANRLKPPTRLKASKQEGLFKHVAKAIALLQANPRHPGLNTHKYSSLQHPYQADGEVFEACAQNRTPGAYRIFWCYGPDQGEITILAITPHP